MAQKRDVLQLLARDELVAIVDRFELEVADRRARDGLIEAVAASKKATLSEILPELSRDRLKDLCRALKLDDSGREKAALVERLLGSKGAAVVAEAPSKGAASSTTANGAGKSATSGASKRTNGAARAPEQVELQLGEKLTVDKLERYLWSAADILRGSIDSSDYKNYIFGMLFLKRLSDRFEEECEALVRDNDDPEERDNHQFFVPKRARWSEIQKVATDLGSALNKACAQLEEANGSLEGVLAGIDYNDERKLGDARARDVVLGRLVQHFSRLSLKNTNLSEPDMLGRAYEYLIEQFADDAGKKGGEFYTPRMVVRLIVELLAPKEGMRICDPTAGSGGMLIECAHYLERQGQDPRNLSLFGQEKNLGTWAICKMNMLLHGLPDARIEKGDTIRDPKLREAGELMLFDRVIANPPFSLDEWGREVAEHDPFGRFRFGVPPSTKGDLAFIQHMLATTNLSGMIGVVMPHGVLFRGGAESDIRKAFLDEDALEAVIGLPTNLFYGTGIPAAILVFNKRKKPARKRRVLFIDGALGFEQVTNQSRLRAQDLERILRAFDGFSDVDKFARVVEFAEIEKNDFNLNISRYVQTADAPAQVDLAQALMTLRVLEQERALAEAAMNSHLRELGYET